MAEMELRKKILHRADRLRELRENISKHGPWNVHLSLDVHIAELEAIAVEGLDGWIQRNGFWVT